jgi:hypothetical protein
LNCRKLPRPQPAARSRRTGGRPRQDSCCRRRSSSRSVCRRRTAWGKGTREAAIQRARRSRPLLLPIAQHLPAAKLRQLAAQVGWGGQHYRRGGLLLLLLGAVLEWLLLPRDLQKVLCQAAQLHLLLELEH